jgi:hypothetical protein
MAGAAAKITDGGLTTRKVSIRVPRNASRTLLRRPSQWRSILSRLCAAALGGYGVATLASILIARVLPLSEAQALGVGLLLSFVVYAGVVIWVFAAASALRAWVGVAAVSIVIAGVLILIAASSRS